MKIRPSVAIIENNHILLMQYHYGEIDVFNLPGGKPDPNELLSQTLERELQEELCIDIEVGKMLLIGEVHIPTHKNDMLHCVFLGSIIGGIPRINPFETSALAVVWKPINELDQLAMYPHVGIELQEFLSGMRTTPYIGKINQEWHG
jgi:8-oxo-dGTP diphosphatase